MRLVRLFCSALIGTSLLAGQQQAPVIPAVPDDRYSVGVVTSALKFVQRGGNSIEAKEYVWPVLSLGDRVSIAALKIYSADELVQTQNTEAYLTVVRNAFSSRRSILDESDTDPKVTLFVLEYLKEKDVSSPGIEKRIEYLERCVKDFKCSSQSEHDFFYKR